jgi:hypothetical protein
MKILAIILFVVGVAFLIYAYAGIANEHNADVSPNEIDEDPGGGKWQSGAGLALIIAGIVIYYVNARKNPSR